MHISSFTPDAARSVAEQRLLRYAIYDLNPGLYVGPEY